MVDVVFTLCVHFCTSYLYKQYSIWTWQLAFHWIFYTHFLCLRQCRLISTLGQPTRSNYTRSSKTELYLYSLAATIKHQALHFNTNLKCLSYKVVWMWAEHVTNNNIVSYPLYPCGLSGDFHSIYKTYIKGNLLLQTPCCTTCIATLTVLYFERCGWKMEYYHAS